MKVTYISTYPPRECGLATFNKNLIGAIASGAGETMASVIAIDAGSNEDEYHYADEVSYVIRQESQDDYVKAAEFINSTDTDVCILQHEFGIFGGDSGIYVLSLINHIEKPLVTILHTVLEKPSGQQKMIIQGLAKRSSRLIVMGRKAIDLLDKIYHISREKIEFIEHGVPDIDAPAINPLQADPLFSTRKVLLTFGLISRNKGLETVVRALPEIVERHPEVVYVVLGNTHPGIKRNSGEEYRDYLVQLSGELGVQNNLVFINRFLAEEELVNYLAQADIFVSPYLNEAQITSGTLSYAVGAGAAVIATPYWHAQELLSNGRGLLFNFHDERGLAAAVNELLDDPEKLRDIKTKAYNYGLNLRWPVIGRKYASVLRWVIENADFGERIFMQVIDTAVIPEFSLDYVRRLTDHTGIVQHAKYGIPNLKEGYCVDDNSRALIMALMACKSGYKEAPELLPVYMSFLHYMQDDSGYFRNFLSASREYLDEKGSEDAFGRTIWALG
ncbi:MAG: glycosyltransferase family 4 protein, partial [Bacteroidetes bacterium]|nr:glycosyltransferase family 4 protein [Bacteroidota bacterium]